MSLNICTVEIISAKGVLLLSEQQKAAGYTTDTVKGIIDRHRESFNLQMNALFEEYYEKRHEALTRFGVAFEGTPIENGDSVLNVQFTCTSKAMQNDFPSETPVILVLREVRI